MDKEDRRKIYTLLSKYYPNAKQLKDPATLTAWGYSLEKFPYEDVKRAVVSYAERNKYFPDLADITALCPPPPRAQAPSRPVKKDDQVETLREKWTDLRARRVALGLPETVTQAKAQGILYRELWAMWEAAGVNL